MYRSYPKAYWLSDVSTIIASGSSGICLTEDHNQTITCTLILYYDHEEKDIKAAKVRNDNLQQYSFNATATKCNVFYEDIFLGRNTTGGEEEV